MHVAAVLPGAALNAPSAQAEAPRPSIAAAPGSQVTASSRPHHQCCSSSSRQPALLGLLGQAVQRRQHPVQQEHQRLVGQVYSQQWKALQDAKVGDARCAASRCVMHGSTTMHTAAAEIHKTGHCPLAKLASNKLALCAAVKVDVDVLNPVIKSVKQVWGSLVCMQHILHGRDDACTHRCLGHLQAASAARAARAALCVCSLCQQLRHLDHPGQAAGK